MGLAAKSAIALLLSGIVLFSAWSAVLCQRGPDGGAILPQYASPDDPCTGSAVVQIFQYKCGALSEVDKNTQIFLKNIQATGKKICEEHCRKRAAGCVGEFTSPAKCGLSISTKDAENIGQFVAQCSPDCSGQSFSYCSIYHAGYTSLKKEFFSHKSPDCACRWK